MIIAVSLIFCSVDHVAAYICRGTEEERERCKEDDKKEKILLYLGIAGVMLIYSAITSAKTEQNETEITSEQLSKLLNKKTHEWVDSKGKLIIYRW